MSDAADCEDCNSNGNGNAANENKVVVDPLFPVALTGSELWKEEVAVLAPPEINPDGVPYPELKTLPQSFDGTQVWHEFMPQLPKMCDCGATWATATTYALNIRYRLWTKNQVRDKYNNKLTLAMGKNVACHWGSLIEYELLQDAINNLTSHEFATSKMYDSPSIGCTSPETIIGGWQYLFRFGAFASPCIENGAFGVCTDRTKAQSVCASTVGPAFSKCLDGTAALVFLAGGFYTLPANEGVIRQEIWKWGPVSSAMRVYDDFFSWNGRGVYSWDGRGKSRGGFAVAIMGWGTEGQQSYWIVAAWDRGFLKIARGIDMAGIESNAVAGFPKIPLAAKHMTYTTMRSEMDTFLGNVWPVHSSGFKLSAIENGLEEGQNILKGRTDLITENMVPDYQSMIAGDPSSIVFQLEGQVWRELPDVYMLLSFIIIACIAVVYLIVKYV